VTFVSVNIPWLSHVSFGLQPARQHAAHNAQQALLLVQDTNLHTHGLHDDPGGLSDELANAPKTQSDTTHMTHMKAVDCADDVERKGDQNNAHQHADCRVFFALSCT
jgi:inosine/xanthosine triphosphate pyrophosphatase family protein